MGPQLYISVYKEQFASPGRVARTELRPSSANRRNNPQPQPDFLFPHSLKTNYRSLQSLSQPLPPVDSGRQPLPPVRHLSFYSPVRTCLDSSRNTVDAGKPEHVSTTVRALPSVDGLRKLQLTEGPTATGIHIHTPLRSPARQHVPTQFRTRPQTSGVTAAQHLLPRRFCLNSTLDSSGCYSCFHVVKPYQAGHYIIHPEFVSESLRQGD